MSPDRLHRYQLVRVWGSGPKVLWIGLNPSVANAQHDDPTIRRMIDFSKSWGMAGMVVCNLFSLVSTDPQNPARALDPTGGQENNRHIGKCAHEASLIVACWGAYRAPERVAAVLRFMADKDVHCLGTNNDGSPKHPLYLAKGTKLVMYREGR